MVVATADRHDAPRTGEGNRATSGSPRLACCCTASIIPSAPLRVYQGDTALALSHTSTTIIMAGKVFLFLVIALVALSFAPRVAAFGAGELILLLSHSPPVLQPQAPEQPADMCRQYPVLLVPRRQGVPSWRYRRHHRHAVQSSRRRLLVPR